jgi:hypothetical protein
MRDNRIPTVIEDFTNGEGGDAVSFLSFEDWRHTPETAPRGWVTVYRSVDDNGDFFTWSACARVADGTTAALLESPDWEVRHQDHGKPYFFTSGTDSDVQFAPNTSETVDGTEFLPFVLHRTFPDSSRNTVELVQHFLLYHEAFHDEERSAFARIDDAGESHTVARIEPCGSGIAILVNEHDLRDYLAAQRCVLVRYHDHRRVSTEDIRADIEGDFEERILGTERTSFRLWLNTRDALSGAYEGHSRLLGKDIIEGYPEADARHTGGATREYETFVIDEGPSGDEIVETCNPDELSNYFTDRGKPHFLTPVFFRRDVLTKYYAAPSKYTVGPRYLSCYTLWGLRMDETREQLVQVWLGDLADLPYMEQKHWRQYNVRPQGQITNERWRADFGAEFTDLPLSQHPHRHALQLRGRVNDLTVAAYGEPLFRDMASGDAYVVNTFHVPLTDEIQEADSQIQAAAKLFVDALDESLIVRLGGDREQKGSINRLKSWLGTMGLAESAVGTIVSPLRDIQSLRSSGSAHLKGKNYARALHTAGVTHMPNSARVAHLLAALVTSLTALSDFLEDQGGA